MGYYANSFDGNINIPHTRLSDLLNAVAEQYTAYNNDEMWGTYKLDIPTTVEELEKELDLMGFEFEYDGVLPDDKYLTICSFDAKWRTEKECLLRALMSVATSDSSMSFRGEDGEMWRFTPQGIQNAKIEWV